MDRAPRRIHRADYRPPLFLVPQLALEIEIAAPITRVAARLCFERSGDNDEPLRLDGVGLRVCKIDLDGAPLAAGEYSVDETGLTIFAPPPRGELHTVVEIDTSVPRSEGLISLDGVLLTNCEPEGFRRITFFPDRPDVLCRMSCVIIAPAREYPTLLSNGLLRETGDFSDGRHFARWDDPFPKASYLFALAAGKFSRLRDTFVTASGRRVQLAVHARRNDLPYCRYGLATLRKAMEWDERAYGREYDLDVLNLVVTRGYPGGAMECKGLNLYATEFFLASARISTDEELLRVAGVVGHEYFHNWSGNRVGCRDWFQLSLKEGFTVFRQQQFVAALTEPVGARIDDVTRLRELQYPEDEGGMAHAVRPESYLAISNFYTRTIYEKGAELIRMMSLIVGERSFSAAVRAFFGTCDGQAATIDQLIDTVERASGIELAQFRRWYDTIGRPQVRLQTEYDALARRCTLTLSQCLSGRDRTKPLHIPLSVGLIDRQGEPLSFSRQGSPATTAECLLELRAEHETFVFDEVASMPVVSILRGFSAPVDADDDLDDDALAVLAIRDADGCNRFEAARRLALRTLHRFANAAPGRQADASAWLGVVEHTLANHRSDAALAGRILRLPSLDDLVHARAQFDLDALQPARAALRRNVAQIFRKQLHAVRLETAARASIENAFDVRRLRNRCLWYLACDAEVEAMNDCREQFRSSATMEDEFAALQLLVDAGGAAREDALDEFQERWQRVPAAFDHWFRVQAGSDAADCAEMVERLWHRRDLSLENATRLKAVFDPFTTNLAAFHHRSGIGCAIVRELVLALNESNPRLAARFLKRFDGWHRFDPHRRSQLERILREVLATPALARELYEIASESLRVGRDACGSCRAKETQ